ncbi:MAG: alpha/beta hydrolase [Limnothrix sp. CACIAM 69d]|nr:MAG: alpha/beta hydrolase [Limnothrix sp. CACIAM 69d]
MATITIRGVPHSYRLDPDRPTRWALVFVHGWLLSRHYWQPLIDQFQPHIPCLSYDLRGFGASQPTQPQQFSTPRERYQNYAPAAYAEDLNRLLEHLGIETAWIVGHSLGGAIALWSAHKFPDRIQGVICLNSGGGIYLKEEFERFRAVGQRLVQFRPQWLRAFPGLDWVFSRDSVARPVARQWGRQRLIDFVTAHPEAALWTLLESTTEAEVHRLPQVVAQLTQPAYFIAGNQDSVMEPRYVRHLASFHPLFDMSGENLREIPDCGHMGMVEQPIPIAQEIKTILQRHGVDRWLQSQPEALKNV